MNRGKISGQPAQDLKQNPVPDGAIEAIFGSKVSENHTANFIEAIRSR